MCGWQGAAGQVSHTCLLASMGPGKCSTGVGTPPFGLLHHRHRRRRRPAAGPPTVARRCVESSAWVSRGELRWLLTLEGREVRMDAERGGALVL